MTTENSKSDEQLHNVVLTNGGNQWDFTANCTVLIHTGYDFNLNIPVPNENTYAIKLNDLLYLGIRQRMMDKLLGKP
jgi:hypothetical protein